MRHKKKVNHLGRTTSHKKALMKNMAAQLIEHKEIKTTIAKAKELRGYVERLVTYGKKGTLHHRRLAFQFLQNKLAVKGLFEEVAPSFKTRNGGYTRIIKLGNRRGDGAPMSLLQFIGFEKVAVKAKAKELKKEKKKTAKTAATAEEQPAQEKVESQIEETKDETKDQNQDQQKKSKKKSKKKE